MEASVETASNRPSAEASTGDSRRLAKMIPGAAVAAALLLAVGIYAVATEHGQAQRGSLAGDAGEQPTTLTTLPLPKTVSPEAARSYSAAMQEYRDGAGNMAFQHLQDALAADRNFAAAHLFLVFMRQGSIQELRIHAEAALRSREMLSERDLAFLEALRANLMNDTPDWPANITEAEHLRDRYPLDATIAFFLGRTLLDAGRTKEGLSAMDHVLALDPKYAYAYAARATVQLFMLGDLDGAIETATRCIAVSPSALTCLRKRAEAEDRRGDCAKFEQDARRMVALKPQAPESYEALAIALAARGASPESVDEALGKRVSLTKEPHSALLAESSRRRMMSLLKGDLGGVLSHAREDEQSLKDTSTESDWSEVTAGEILAYEEVGDGEGAARVAGAYMSHLAAWTPDDPVTARPLVLMALHKANRIAEQEFRATRGTWLSDAKGNAGGGTASAAWIDFYSRPARSSEDAQVALESLPEYAPLPPVVGMVPSEEAIGHVYLLAGRPADAIPPLKRAVAACSFLRSPLHAFGQVRAQQELGEALAMVGNRERACAAYGGVIARWGTATPRSVTAEKARAYSAALRCGDFVRPTP